MKKFRYTFTYEGEINVLADSDEEAFYKAQDLVGDKVELEQTDKIPNEPTGGDGRDD